MPERQQAQMASIDVPELPAPRRSQDSPGGPIVGRIVVSGTTLPVRWPIAHVEQLALAALAGAGVAVHVLAGDPVVGILAFLTVGMVLLRVVSCWLFLREHLRGCRDADC